VDDRCVMCACISHLDQELSLLEEEKRKVVSVIIAIELVRK